MCTANQRICLGCSSNLLTLLRRSAAVAQWFQMAKNPPKNKFTQSDFTSFSISYVYHILITFVSGLCVRFTFKTCQIVAGISMNHQFHEIFILSNTWRVFYIWPNYASPPHAAVRGGGLCKAGLGRILRYCSLLFL